MKIPNWVLPEFLPPPTEGVDRCTDDAVDPLCPVHGIAAYMEPETDPDILSIYEQILPGVTPYRMRREVRWPDA